MRDSLKSFNGGNMSYVETELAEEDKKAKEGITVCYLCFYMVEIPKLKDHIKMHDFVNKPEKTNLLIQSGLDNLKKHSTLNITKLLGFETHMNSMLKYILN